MNTLRTSRPSLYMMLVALLMSAGAFALMQTDFGAFTDTSPSVVMRTAFVAATYLLMFDVLEGAHFARCHAGGVKSPHFWIYAFYMGYFWTVLMILMGWSGMDSAPSLLLTWGGAGVFFGIAVAWMGVPDGGAVEAMYDVDKPMTGSAFAVLYYAWPIITVALVAGFVMYPPSNGWAENYFLFQLIVLGSLMPLFRHLRTRLWTHIWPRVLGIALLMFGLLFGDGSFV